MDEKIRIVGSDATEMAVEAVKQMTDIAGLTIFKVFKLLSQR